MLLGSSGGLLDVAKVQSFDHTAPQRMPAGEALFSLLSDIDAFKLKFSRELLFELAFRKIPPQLRHQSAAVFFMRSSWILNEEQKTKIRPC